MIIGPKNPLSKYVRVMFRGVELDDVLSVDTRGWVAKVIDPPHRVCDPAHAWRTPCGECHMHDGPHLAVKNISGVHFEPKPHAPKWARLVCIMFFGDTCRRT